MLLRVVFAIVLAFATGGLSARAAELGEQIDDCLADMTTAGSAYDPKRLHELGLPGLVGLLDRLYPETAPASKPPPPALGEEVRRLIGQLGDEDFRTREQATERLIELGKAHQDLLQKAAGSDDAEVRLRARRILAAWTPRAGGLVEQALGGYWKYAEGIRDRERLEALARRTIAVLDRGWPDGSKVHLTRLCIAGVAKGGDEAACDLLRPLLDHEDVRVAKLVVETIGSYKDKAFFPRLLVEALASERDEVVEVAVRWCQKCDDQGRAEEIRRALRTIFAGRDEALKFQSCLVLTQSFDDADAWLFLLDQTQSKEPLRAASALSRLADTPHSGQPATVELLGKVGPHLQSAKLHLRWGAAKVLGTHSGKEVVERLIPLLADKEQSVADEARRGIEGQSDQALVRKLLGEAAASHVDQAVRLRAQWLFERPSRK